MNNSFFLRKPGHIFQRRPYFRPCAPILEENGRRQLEIGVGIQLSTDIFWFNSHIFSLAPGVAHRPSFFLSRQYSEFSSWVEDWLPTSLDVKQQENLSTSPLLKQFSICLSTWRCSLLEVPKPAPLSSNPEPFKDLVEWNGCVLPLPGAGWEPNLYMSKVYSFVFEFQKLFYSAFQFISLVSPSIWARSACIHEANVS